MEFSFQARNMELSSPVRDYAEKKLSRLGRYLRDITETRVEFSREQTRSSQNRHVVQVTLFRKGSILRGEERAADIYAAIDSVADIMRRQIERHRGRHYRSEVRAPLPRPASPQPSPSESSLELIVRTKRHPVKPLPPEEAVEQMELLGHDFFFFINAETEKHSVVYRRKDGGYGLIEPEV